MRRRVLSPAWAAAALLAAAPAPRAHAQGMPDGGPDAPEHLVLLVGERARLCTGTCHSPICDDPSVAAISGDGLGLLEARRPGTTTCSVDQGLGLRRIIVVTVEASPQPTAPAAAAAPGPPPAWRDETGSRPAATPAPAEEEAIFSWTDPDGSIHYGRASDVPEKARARARQVTPGRDATPRR